MHQQSRANRQLKVEDFYYKDSEVVAEDGKTDLTVECAKLAVSISNNVSKEVKTTVKGATSAKKSQPNATSSKRRTKKSSILASHGAGPPMTGVRRSTRKRLEPSWYVLIRCFYKS